MPNTYYSVLNQVRRLPVLYKSDKTLIPGIDISYFAKEAKEFDKSGQYLTSYCEGAPLVKLTESYFHKIKGFTWYEHIPFFKKISTTRETFDDHVVDVIRVNGRGSSSKTTHDANGIRISKVQKKLIDSRKNQYEYTRLVFNERGTEPQTVAKWEDTDIPLNDLV